MPAVEQEEVAQTCSQDIKGLKEISKADIAEAESTKNAANQLFKGRR